MRARCSLIILLVVIAAQVAGQDDTHVRSQKPQTLVPGSEVGRERVARAAGLYQILWKFDFDEQKYGNYEQTPMYWEPLRGPGLPTYNRGRFNFDDGHDAPPCYRLSVQTGNIAYEYRSMSIHVVPEADYLVVGHIRPIRLRHAAAFLAGCFVDRFGVAIPGSHRVSSLVRAEGDGPQDWQRVEIAMPGEFPTAFAVRLQMWILQDNLWKEPSPYEVAPIERRDVNVAADFDDITVYYLPRTRLHLDRPGNVLRASQQGHLQAEISNATPAVLSAELVLRGSGGRLILRRQTRIQTSPEPSRFFGLAAPTAQPLRQASDTSDAPRALSRWDVPLPQLEPGLYDARLAVRSGGTELVERTLRFAVVADLPIAATADVSFGIDLGPWPGGSLEDVLAAVRELGCGSVRIGLSARRRPASERVAELNELAALLRRLAEQRVDTVGVLLAPPRAEDQHPQKTHTWMQTDLSWPRGFAPILARLGGLVAIWQLGSEALELARGGGWQRPQIEQMRTFLRRFVTVPTVAVPRDVTRMPGPDGGDVQVVWIPPTLPTPDIPRALDFLLRPQQRRPRVWVSIATRHQPDPRLHAAELARRLVLARAMGPERVFVAAPLVSTAGSGQRRWEPTESFPWLRTLFTVLGNRRAIAAIRPADDVLGVIFAGSDGACLVLWTWRDRPRPKPVSLYLGPRTRALDLWGRPVPLEHRNWLVRVPLAPTPIILDRIEVGLAVLQASYRLEPNEVVIDRPAEQPVLRFVNPFDDRMSGTLAIRGPATWSIQPDSVGFVLEPHQRFRQKIDIRLPPEPLAGDEPLRVEMNLEAPLEARLGFDEQISVGLSDIRVEATARWEGSDLIIEQTLRNRSNQTISFTAFCEPPGHARAEGLFLNVLPGQTSLLTYLFPNATNLAGQMAFTGVREIRGRRALHMLIPIPNPP